MDVQSLLPWNWGKRDDIKKKHESSVSLFDEFWRSPFLSYPSSGIEIKEERNKVTVHVDIPGMKKEDVSLHYRDGILTISGTKKSVNEEKRKGYSFTSSSYGSFQRSVKLPKGVEWESAKAKLRNGSLKITIPKDKNYKPNRIEVAVH